MKKKSFAFSPALLAASVSPRVLLCVLAAVLLVVVIVAVVLVVLSKKRKAKAAPAAEKPAPEKPAEKPVEALAAQEPETTEDEDVCVEEPISLRESMAVARQTAHSMNWNKKAIAEDLRTRHAGEVEINERVNETTTGLPLADTHYAVDHKTRKCFVYVYETEGSPMLLINSDEELAAELCERHGNVHKSAFPKSKDQWYSLPLDDTYSKEEVQSVLDRCHAHVLGRDAKAIALKPSLPDPVAVVSAGEVNALISDEAAEAAIEEEYTGRATGKKVIVNVDSLSASFNAGDTVTLQALKEKGLVPKNAAQVKLLAHGTLDKVLHVELQDYSLDAVKMVLATGGTVKHVAPPAGKK